MFHLDANVWLVLLVPRGCSHRQSGTSRSRGSANGSNAGGTASPNPTTSPATSVATNIARPASPTTTPIRIDNAATSAHDATFIINIFVIIISDAHSFARTSGGTDSEVGIDEVPRAPGAVGRVRRVKHNHTIIPFFLDLFSSISILQKGREGRISLCVCCFYYYGRMRNKQKKNSAKQLFFSSSLLILGLDSLRYFNLFR